MISMSVPNHSRPAQLLKYQEKPPWWFL